jgi:hypothetical protein
MLSGMSREWNFFEELSDRSDIAFWAGALAMSAQARTLFREVTEQLWDLVQEDPGQRGKWWTMSSWAEVLLDKPAAELLPLVRHTEAEGLACDDRTLEETREGFSQMASGLRSLATVRGRKLSIRRWVAEDSSGEGEVLFLPYDETAESRIWACAWMSSTVRRALFGVGGRRLWLVADGIDRLPAIVGLNESLSELARGNVRLVLAFESQAGLAEVYGEEEARVLASAGSVMDIGG